MLCTRERIFIGWEFSQYDVGLPAPGTNSGSVTDQLYFSVIENDGTALDPILLDTRYDGYDQHPQLVLDGDTLVVTWLRADRGPQNHDELMRLDCAQ
jgi:hypothetical protein